MRSFSDYKRGIESLYEVVDKDGKSVPFKLNPVQERMLKEFSGNDIILKSRQQGMSSLILALFTADFLTTENIKCVVISHEAKATQRLFDRVKFYLESVKRNFPGGESPFELTYNSRTEIYNKSKNSTFYIGTAGAKSFGHGDTINNLHCSEVSRWENQEELLNGLLQAVPKSGRVFVETTANGYGNYFHSMWVKNNSTQFPFRTHFVPWFETPEYVMPVPPGMLELDDEERDLVAKYKLSKEQIQWRRYQVERMNGNIDRFNEQYPATWEIAFILSGNPVWSPSLLRWYLMQTRDPLARGNLVGYNNLLTLEKNEKGNVTIFAVPEEFHRYVIGADVSEGIIVSENDDSKERDYSCAQVLDASTMEQVAVWHGRIDPDLFGRELEKLGRYYNDALVAVEKNAMGLTPLTVLRDLNYANLYYREKFGLIAEKTTAELGWVTDATTKEMIINDATHLFREKRIMLYDNNTIDEMMSFVRGTNGKAGAASSSHDDRVMSLLIAIEMLKKPQVAMRGNPIEQGDFSKNAFYMDGVAFGSDGMPVDPNSFDGSAEDFSF